MCSSAPNLKRRAALAMQSDAAEVRTHEAEHRYILESGTQNLMTPRTFP